MAANPVFIWRAKHPPVSQILAAGAGLDGGDFHRLQRRAFLRAFLAVHRAALALAVPAHVGRRRLTSYSSSLRKCAHLTEYAVFALLLWRAIRRPQKNHPLRGTGREARLTLLLVMLYAASDEFHQSLCADAHARRFMTC